MIGKTRMRPRLAVVVPVYGNEASLPELYARIIAASEAAGVELTLQFVNDRSPDNSQAVLESLAVADPRVRCILLSRNHGSFVAIAAGLAQVADHDAAIILSADLQDPPEIIPRLVDAWRAGKRVVLCARAQRDDPLTTRIFARVFHWIFRRIALKDMPPGGFDFCLIDRAVVRVILESSEKKTSLIGLILWSGFEREVIEYQRAPRKHGKSMWSLGRKLSYAFHSLVAFSSFPMKVSFGIGLALACLSLVSMVYILVASALGRITSPGWPSMMLSQLVIIDVLFLGFGVIGGYLWINLEQTRKRPLFIIDRRVGSSLAGSPDGQVAFFGPGSVSSPVLPQLKEAAGRVFRAPRDTSGRQLARFEREFAAWMGTGYCVGVGSGADAVTLALWAADLEPGVRVAVPALAAPAVAMAVLRAGCRPIFVDVREEDLTLDARLLDRAVALGATAVLPVHLYGNPCDMDGIMAAAGRLGLTVIEDCARCAGTAFGDTSCGCFGRASSCDFSPTATLGGYGNGGAVLTADPAVAEKLRMLRHGGRNAAGECVVAGLDSCLDALEAALLSERLRVVDDHNAARCRIADLYDRRLAFLRPVTGLTGRVPQLYVVRPGDREAFRAHLAACGVETAVHYPLALTRHAYLAANSLGDPCPVAEQAATQVVSLPCHPGMHATVAERVAEACLGWPGKDA